MKRSFHQLQELLPFLPAGAKGYILRYCVFSSLLALLDVAALALLALSIAGMLQGDAVRLPLLGTIQPSGYIWVVIAVATLILTKSALQIWLQWRVTRKYASFELAIGARLFTVYMTMPWERRLATTMSKSLRMVDVGVASVNAGLLIPLTGLPAVFSTTLLILAVLLVANPVTAVVTAAYLGAVAVVLYAVLSKRTVEAGRVNRKYAFRVSELMQGMLGAMKELTLRGKIPEVSSVLQLNRSRSTHARANINFLSSVPRFVLDVALIGGFVVVGGAAFLLSGSTTQAFTAIALFGVAGLRLIPSLTTFQSANNALAANSSQVDIILRDLSSQTPEVDYAKGQGPSPELLGALEMHSVTYAYPESAVAAVADVSLKIPFGSTAGFVGESGSGKSTLIDLLLGFLAPQAGKVTVGDVDIDQALGWWRSSVGYVPQDVALFRGTVAQNVALTWGDNFDRAQVELCLRKARLWEAIASRPRGMDSDVAEGGKALSGGQRQRLGIARALYSNPSVLILDEATSALDTKTEAEILREVAELGGDLTVISVAHRLASIRYVDQLFYLADGELVAKGSFEEVLLRVPEFRQQAVLAGLLTEETSQQIGKQE